MHLILWKRTPVGEMGESGANSASTHTRKRERNPGSGTDQCPIVVRTMSFTHDVTNSIK